MLWQAPLIFSTGADPPPELVEELAPSGPAQQNQALIVVLSVSISVLLSLVGVYAARRVKAYVLRAHQREKQRQEGKRAVDLALRRGREKALPTGSGRLFADTDGDASAEDSDEGTRQ
jgi:hypothetical protein